MLAPVAAAAAAAVTGAEEARLPRGGVWLAAQKKRRCCCGCLELDAAAAAAAAAAKSGVVCGLILRSSPSPACRCWYAGAAARLTLERGVTRAGRAWLADGGSSTSGTEHRNAEGIMDAVDGLHSEGILQKQLGVAVEDEKSGQGGYRRR